MKVVLENNIVYKEEKLGDIHFQEDEFELPADVRFVEVQDGWVTAWGGADEMPVEIYMIDPADDGDNVKVWVVDGSDITSENWRWSAGRVSILDG